MAGKPLPFSLEQLRSIVEQYPTPFHLYDAGGIRRCIRGLQAAFGWNPGFREYFAVKATPTPGILALLRDLGCGMDCASMTELMLCQRLGITGDRISVPTIPRGRNMPTPGPWELSSTWTT